MPQLDTWMWVLLIVGGGGFIILAVALFSNHNAEQLRKEQTRMARQVGGHTGAELQAMQSEKLTNNWTQPTVVGGSEAATVSVQADNIATLQGNTSVQRQRASAFTIEGPRTGKDGKDRWLVMERKLYNDKKSLRFTCMSEGAAQKKLSDLQSGTII